jgi:small conductance mechanosensitive channel
LIFRIIGLTGVVAGLLTDAGISAFIIGFALKDIGENLLAGILLVFKRPFRIGDVVDINRIRGEILTLNLWDTQIKKADGKDVFFPNAAIVKNPLVNFTIDGFLRYYFIIGLDYGSDYKAAMALILNTVSKGLGGLADQKSSNVWVSDLAESTLNIQATFWVVTFDLKILDVVVKSNVILEVLTLLEKKTQSAGPNYWTEKPSRKKPVDLLVIYQVSLSNPPENNLLTSASYGLPL